MNMRSFCALRRTARTLPMLSTATPKRTHHPSVLRHRTYSSSSSNNNNELLERLRNGEITKAEVQRLIMNQSALSSRISELSSSKTITPMSSDHQSGINVGKISMASSSSSTGAAMPIVSSSLGSAKNPLHMRRQTSFKELIFSLFPFLFIFWMLGGLDLIKNRKQGGGPMGGMFGSNFSEWDEEDWEDDGDEELDTDDNNGDKQFSQNKQSETDNADEESEEDRRTAFFRKLGIDLEANRDDAKDGSNVGTQSMTGAAAKKEKKRRKRVRFKNVCGNAEAKLELADIVDYLKHPAKYQKMGCTLPKGVLMAGPPGTGKTLLARALAGEAGVPFLATNGASFDEIFVGVGVMRVKKLFERAKERAPCIVFIDEIDAIANTRMQMGTAHSSDSLNALLSELDGFEQNSGVVVIAATNMADRLDPALVRPGRFDRKVHLQLPDKQARADIVRLYLGDRGDDTVDVSELVGDVSGFSGAELESMVNLASIECVKAGKELVSHLHLVEAKEVISMGRARTTLDVGLKTKRVTAYHEGGHAIVSLYTRGAKPVYKATILPRGSALGFVATINEDEFMATKESLLAQMDVCMAGRAAEELYSGATQITTGASSDFNQATRIATAMVCQYGMSQRVGRVYYEDVTKLSPDTQNVINAEVRRLLDESYHRAKTLLAQRRTEWETLANGLLEKETLSGQQIRNMVNYQKSDQVEPLDFVLANVNENGGGSSSSSASAGRKKKSVRDKQIVLTPPTRSKKKVAPVVNKVQEQTHIEPVPEMLG